MFCDKYNFRVYVFDDCSHVAMMGCSLVANLGGPWLDLSVWIYFLYSFEFISMGGALLAVKW